MCGKACMLFLLTLLGVCAVLCSDSNDILQHLYDLEEGSAQRLQEMQIEDEEVEAQSPGGVPTREEGPGVPLEEESPDKMFGYVFKVPAEFHFVEMKKDSRKDEAALPDDPSFEKVEDLFDGRNVPAIAELEKEADEVLEASHEDELEILGLAVISKIVLYIAIVLLVLGAIVCTKVCCPHPHRGRKKRGFVRMKDSDPPKTRPEKLQQPA